MLTRFNERTICCLVLLLLVSSPINVNSFSSQGRLSIASRSDVTSRTISFGRVIKPHPLAATVDDAEGSTTTSFDGIHLNNRRHLTVGKRVTTLALISAISLSTIAPSSSFLHPNNANAYESSDYASDAIITAVQSVKDSTGDNARTMKAFENIAEIITEGKGIGGSQNSPGVNLPSGLVTDEDNSIYNPGLSILTESEKNRLLDSLIQSRTDNKTKKAWTSDSEYAFKFLKQKLDPLHMTEVSGYLGILPYYGAVLYLGSLAVQQAARDSFPFVYIASAAAIFAPPVVLIALGS